MSEFPTCPARQRLTMFLRDGKQYVQRCTAQEAEKANENVEAEDCLECPVRALLVHDERKHVPASQRPPKDHRAHLKADTAGGGFPDCKERLLMEIKPTCGSCGGTVKVKVCNEDKAPHFKGKVDAAICSACPFRTSSGGDT